MKICIMFLAVLGAVTCQQRRAIVVLKGKENVNGHVTFTETPHGLKIVGQVTGLEPGLHGFHIHAKGDLSNGCDSAGGHFNPHNKSHGAPASPSRHVGDLGNIHADQQGVATIDILDNLVTLGGENCIVGRAVVVHSGEDDLGLGSFPDSLTTGHAGSRVACGVIGVLSPEHSWHNLRDGASGVHRVSHGLVTSFLAAILLLTLF